VFKKITDKNGQDWNLFKDWSQLGVVYGGAKFARCPICSDSRKYNPQQKCLSIHYEHKNAFCNHCPEKFMLDDGDDTKINPVTKKRDVKVYHKPKIKILQNFPVNIANFLTKRCLTDEVIERNKVGHDTKFFHKEKKNKPCVVIPYFKDGEIVGAKYRTNPKDWTAEAGTEPIVYGYDDIKGDWLIWVEGEFDKLAVEVAGFENCVSVPNGAKSFGCIDNIADKLKLIKKHVIAVDNDMDGAALKNELIRRLGAGKCRTVSFPEKCKDANDVLMNHDKETLKKCIEENKRVPIKGIVKPSELIEQLIDAHRNGEDSGLSTGWENIDRLYRVVMGQWTVITGIPNHGKSEFLDAMMINLIRLHQLKFGIFSPENSPIRNHLKKLLRKIENKPFGNGYNGHMTEDVIMETSEMLDEFMTFIATDEDAHSIESLIEMIENLVFSEGINCMIIDPWNVIEHKRVSSMTETEYISSALSKITFLCRKLNIHIWIVAHPMKLQKLSSGKYPVPMPYDIAGSAHWNNKCDNAISVYCDRGDDIPENEVQIHVTKVRFRENGQPGETRLYYDRMSGRYATK
jgi:twinkle protein